MQESLYGGGVAYTITAAVSIRYIISLILLLRILRRLCFSAELMSRLIQFYVENVSESNAGLFNLDAEQF